ncbi:ABC transporter substrate-binding protein [Desulfamplus magnetovallimortis]|uniref:ABC transporter substrate-binding protein n=1 Tax=Desulfamplus magnetovallimortis TaxID=1246637 RepID=UPI0016452D76|nr:ABC transporter substrate-binding protein [Desulfamplus magnetovallimortis]
MIANSSPEPVNVAAILSITGIASPHNKPLIPLIELAVDEINSNGGLLGHPLRLMMLDNKSTPIGSIQAARDAVLGNAVAVIGAHWSSHSLAMAPVLQKAAIPMISLSTNPDITLVGDYIFRINFNDIFQGEMLARFARTTLGAQSAAVLKNLNEAYCLTLAKYFAGHFRELGGKILFESGYKGDAVDFKEIVSGIKVAAPDVVFIPGYSRDSGFLIKQAHMQGIKTVFIGGDAWDDIRVYAGDALDGSFCTSVWHPRMDNPASRHMQAKYHQKYDQGEIESKINFSAVPWYDAFMLLKDAVKRAKSLERADIRDALAATREFQGASGTVNLDLNGDPVGKEMVILKYDSDTPVFFRTLMP